MRRARRAQNAKRKIAALGGGDPGGGLSKKQNKRANQAARKAGGGALALLNGGVGDGGGGYTRLPPIAGDWSRPDKKKGAGKGASKGNTTFQGKPICFNWNNGKPCRDGDGCAMVHVCLKCNAKDHPAISCTKPQ